MTKPSETDLTKLSAREYAETMHQGWGEFKARAHREFTLYFHPGSRYRVIYEQHSEHGFGYDRMEALGEIGVNASDVDAAQFAQDFVEHFCQQLSLHDLSYLIPALTKFRDDWEAERQASIAKMKEDGLM